LLPILIANQHLIAKTNQLRNREFLGGHTGPKTPPGRHHCDRFAGEFLDVFADRSRSPPTPHAKSHGRFARRRCGRDLVRVADEGKQLHSSPFRIAGNADLHPEIGEPTRWSTSSRTRSRLRRTSPPMKPAHPSFLPTNRDSRRDSNSAQPNRVDAGRDKSSA